MPHPARSIVHRLALRVVLGAVVLMVGVLGCSGPAAPPPAPRHVVFIMIDTLRADHVGAYGYSRETTPTIDALAANGTLFEDVVSQSSWTQPSLASMMTSLYPSEVGADYKFSVLPEDARTFAEHLAEAGFRTRAAVTNPHADPSMGIMQGFEAVEIESNAPAGWVVDRGIEAVDAHLGESPSERLLLYLHFMDVHSPLEPPAEYARLFARPGEEAVEPDHRQYFLPHASRRDPEQAERARVRSIALYDAAMRYVDDEIGRLLRHLEATGLRDETLVVVTSDHGEMHWDHVELERALRLRGNDKFIGVGHGYALFPELLHVPLVLSIPGSPGGQRVPQVVRSLDLVPTLLSILGLEPMSDVRGRDVLAGGPEGASEVALSRTRSKVSEHVSLRDGDRLYVRIGDQELLWDWSDPALHDRADALPDEKARLTTRLDELESSLDRQSPEKYAIPPELVPLFEALGYVETTPSDKQAPPAEGK